MNYKVYDEMQDLMDTAETCYGDCGSIEIAAMDVLDAHTWRTYTQRCILLYYLDDLDTSCSYDYMLVQAYELLYNDLCNHLREME